MPERTGILYLVSGPSGSGKTTLCRRLAEEGEASYAISCTTRPPRPGETHGTDYFFLSREEFISKVEQGDFIEHAEVHGNYYGTLHSEVVAKLEQGIDVVMDIDVQGADLVRACPDPVISNALVDLFVMPPNEEELRARLTNRATDDPEIIERRMKNSLGEISQWPKYTYRLISSTRENDYALFKSLLEAERLKTSRITDLNQ